MVVLFVLGGLIVAVDFCCLYYLLVTELVCLLVVFVICLCFVVIDNSVVQGFVALFYTCDYVWVYYWCITLMLC